MTYRVLSVCMYMAERLSHYRLILMAVPVVTEAACFTLALRLVAQSHSLPGAQLQMTNVMHQTSSFPKSGFFSSIMTTTTLASSLEQPQYIQSQEKPIRATAPAPGRTPVTAQKHN